ncbi:IS1634 family transposase, partial [Candidatus Neptunochlamydia vexilliferae]
MMEEFSSKDMDHLGLVAGMCDEIGLVETINQITPPDPRAHLSAGECMKLMIINGLGFTSRPLYLEAQFFSTKPIKRLLGREIDEEEISDDRLGRALDRIYEADPEKIFSTIATQAAIRFNVNKRFQHLDSTSMSVHGEYEEGIGLIQFGYSKDNNPNLKQFMISLMSSQDGDVPLLAQTISGNTSDKKHFREVLKDLKKEIQEAEAPSYYVADSAFYVKETIEEVSKFTKWITRVPENITASRDLIRSLSKEEMSSYDNGYFASEVCSVYGGINQRWVVVFSQKAYDREVKTVERQVSKTEDKCKIEMNKFCRQEYSCKSDALKGLEAFRKKLKYHKCIFLATEETVKMEKRGRPKKTDKGKTIYRLKCILER